MPFGLKMSQDVFQTKIDQAFEGCKGVIGIADDIVVLGKTTEEHDCNMHVMLKRCIDTGIKLNPDKCFVKQGKIKFFEGNLQPRWYPIRPRQSLSFEADASPYKSPRTANLPRASEQHGPIYPKPKYTDEPCSVSS